MLKQRILTAVLLLAVVVPVVFAETATPFFILAAILLAAAMWEWMRLNHVRSALALGAGLVYLALTLCVAFYLDVSQIPGLFWVGITLLWATGGGWLLRYGLLRWGIVPLFVRVFAGGAVLVAAWLAVCQARLLGVNFLFSVLGLVWAADIGAYFFGKAFGQRIFKQKLAPTISPGKSWEGAAGGALVVLAVGLIWMNLGDSLAASNDLFSRLMHGGWWFWCVSVLALTALSVMGDLVESLIKRVAGVKDSSRLLPGHGGVLDRVDALLPVLPAAMALTTWISQGV